MNYIYAICGFIMLGTGVIGMVGTLKKNKCLLGMYLKNF